jgi:hypothetical protein
LPSPPRKYHRRVDRMIHAAAMTGLPRGPLRGRLAD